MKKNSIYVFIIAIGLILSACGSNDKPDGTGGGANGTKLFEAKPAKVTLNNLDFSTLVPFVKKVDQNVKLEFTNFRLDLEGCDLDGDVAFAPDPLVLNGTKGSQKPLAIIGKVKNNCTPTSYHLVADKTISTGGKSKTIKGEQLFSTKLDANGNPVGSLDPNKPVVDGNFSFYNIPSSVTINKTETEYPIKIQLIDKATKGVSGKTVEILAYDVRYGEIKEMKVTTDDNGFANFLYTSPKDLSSINGQTLPLTVVCDANGTRIDSANITLSFSSINVSPTDYHFFNAKNIVVTEALEEQEITVDLVDNNNHPVVGKDVKITVIPSDFGSITPATARTNAAGRAVFRYIAPRDLSKENGNSTTITFSFTDENGNTIAPATANIDIQAGGIVVGTAYAFINESNTIIEHGGQKTDVKVQLIYNGVPVSGKEVSMLAFDKKYGDILNGYKVRTDNGGYATFVYVAPTTLDDVNATTINLTMQFNEGANHLESNATIIFSETTDSIEGNVTLPIVVIPSNLREITLDSNSKTIDIVIRVYKDISPYKQGKVKVELPEKVLNGVDVGSFDAYEVEVNDQGMATFRYTGPSNLQALINNNDTESIFKFYHVENAQDKQEMRVLYQLPQNPHITRNYEIDIITSGDFSMGIPEKEKTFNVLLKAKDGAGNNADLNKEQITKITVETTNSTIAQILDTSNNTLVDSLELMADNNSPFILISKKLSGLVPVRITVEFSDANGDPQTISTIVNVRVFSGPPSAISISYVGTGQDSIRAKYIEKFAISATDEYGNRVNTKPNITLGAIVGYAVDGLEATKIESHNTRRLFYGKSSIDNGSANGEIKALGDKDVKTTEFEDNTAARTDVFQYVNAEGNNTDKLVIFGTRKNYEAMGKWDIELGGDNHTLTLQDNYYGIDRSDLSYAVGHNYYQDQCRQDGREWVGSTDSETYQLDEEGTVVISYKYDYHLGGKDALVWVNLDGIQPDTGKKTRIGEVNKAPLRTAGLTKTPTAGFKLAKGTSAAVTFKIWHENAPERYRNAHFAYDVKSGSTCYSREIASSNYLDARTCNNVILGDDDNNASTPPVAFGNSFGGTYVSFYLEAPLDKDCTFDLENITVSSEF